MNGNIVEKVEVRRKLNAYKTVVKDKINNIHKELDEMKNACTTTAMENVWLSSKENAVLRAKYEVLSGVVQDIFDLLDEFQDDEN